MSNILIYVDKLEYISDYRKAGVSAFLFGLSGYCVGYNTYTLDEIKNVEVSNKYLLINRVLDCKAIDELKVILKDISGIKGIVFEDIGLVNVLKDYNVEKILFQNHFGTNKESINFWLDRVDSVFVSNEITYEEIDYICKNVKKDVVLHLYGYNQVMYSRRLLLSNWSDRFNIEKKSTNVISDISSGIKFRAMENEYGTVMYSQNIFNGSRLLGLDNVKYYYVNTTMIDHDVIMDFLSNKEHISEDEDNGFLDRETIYKLKGRDK
ncbi:MAG: U32 family peptidase [Candidatus Coprovivens sp.]